LALYREDSPMIRGFVPDNGRLRVADDPLRRFDEALWLDLVNPTDAEEATLERRLGIDIPTREEMEAIEISSRLYHEGDATFMTATLPARTDTDDLLMWPVTFVLSGSKLITVRYHEPRAFKTFPQRAEQASLGFSRGDVILVALLEAVIDRIADVLERAQHDVDAISHDIFATDSSRATRDYYAVLRLIGRKGDLLSDLRDSLVSLQRLTGFFAQTAAQQGGDTDLRGRIETVSHDVQSLTDQTAFLSQKVTFLMDATLGMVNIEQNNIIKIFTIAAGVFLPPTLIASVYGMNFLHMPELRWPLGYPLAVVAMVLSAVVPYWYFRRRGWL
jgi:magnesium transporter